MKNSTFDVISPRDAYASYMMGGILVDVRTPSEIENIAIDLKKLKVIPFEDWESRISELPKNQKVVFFSRVGVKGQEAAKVLSKYGFYNVAMVEGGITAWEEAGLPVKH